MARPSKKRFVCCAPKNNIFSPMEKENSESILLSLDEYETIRLIDLQNYTQEDCAEQMHISRTTVQGIYNDARKKLADALVNSKKLIISGGNCVLCKQYQKQCGKGCKNHCHKHQCHKTKLED